MPLRDGINNAIGVPSDSGNLKAAMSNTLSILNSMGLQGGEPALSRHERHGGHTGSGQGTLMKDPASEQCGKQKSHMSKNQTLYYVIGAVAVAWLLTRTS